MTAMYTIHVDASASVDVFIELEIEADSKAEAIEKFRQEAKYQIQQLPFGHAEIQHCHCDGVPDDYIEVTSVEEYEDDDEPEDEEDD